LRGTLPPLDGALSAPGLLSVFGFSSFWPDFSFFLALSTAALVFPADELGDRSDFVAAEVGHGPGRLSLRVETEDQGFLGGAEPDRAVACWD